MSRCITDIFADESTEAMRNKDDGAAWLCACVC